MRLFNDAKSYATQEAATRKLERELKAFGIESLHDIRWCLVATSEGRYVPTVQVGNRPQFALLAHRGVGVM